MKQIRLNVNLFFSVPDDYVVTDTESVDIPLVALIGDDSYPVAGAKQGRHQSIETVDMSKMGDN